MAKTRPKKSDKKRKKTTQNGAALSPELVGPLLDQAMTSLHTGQPDEALVLAKKALSCLAPSDGHLDQKLATLELLGEIYIELGDQDEARKSFAEAVGLDPSGLLTGAPGGGADKFLWLAQLSEEGGAESIGWYEKGAAVLRREISAADETKLDEDEVVLLEMKRDKLANALCGAAEVYMTDLSWEEDAEQRCEAFVTEACLVAPDSPEPLQTLASVRISQGKFEDARSALDKSLEMWKDLPPEDPEIPDFPTRVSLSRLLMESGMEEKALEVLERLVTEDDSSVEAWYLGGWCLHLLAAKQSETSKESENTTNETISDRLTLLKGSRDWLENSLRLYNMQDYEDDRLKDHAVEVMGSINDEIGPPTEDAQEGDEDAWEDEDDDDNDDDESMEDP